MKNAILSVFLLFSFAAPAVIYFVMIRTEKKQIRQEVQERIISNKNNNGLVLFKFNRRDVAKLVNWEHSKEFEYRGIMYDVVSIKVEGDSIIYYCYCDIKESVNNERLKEYLVNLAGESNQKTTFQNARKPFRILYIPSEYCILFFYNSICKKLFNPNCTLNRLFYIIPPTPPPR